MRKRSFPSFGFFPDATFGVVRSLSFEDLKKTGINCVMINTFHLWQTGALSLIEKSGDIKSFWGWKGFVSSDSGGWQVLSLIERGKGKILERGLEFHIDNKKYFFTPEKSIQVQFVLGSDLKIVLDDCPPPHASKTRLKESIRRTVEWARRSKEEFLSQIEKRRPSRSPLLLAPIQGGNDLSLRERCFFELEKIGFDGYGLGGWFLDKKGKPQEKLISFLGSLIPPNKIAFALGVGDPYSVALAFRAGFRFFDCVLPTRDARHGRLYVFKAPIDKLDLAHPDFYSYLYIKRAGFRSQFYPVSEYCDCLTCTTYTRAFLSYLFHIGDPLALRLASIHNLRFYVRLITRLHEIYD